jgi:transposase
MAEQLRVRQDLALLDALDPLAACVERHVGQLSLNPRWSQQVPFLLQLPGLGMVCAMTILAAVGDISRFPTSKQLVGEASSGRADSCLWTGAAQWADHQGRLH